MLLYLAHHSSLAVAKRKPMLLLTLPLLTLLLLTLPLLTLLLLTLLLLTLLLLIQLRPKLKHYTTNVTEEPVPQSELTLFLYPLLPQK